MKVNDFYDKAYLWILDKGPSFLEGITVLIAGLWVVKILSRWMSGYLIRKEIDLSLTPFFLSLTSTVLRVVLVIAAMQIIGIQRTVFAALI